jgi:D-glycero-D-manno-heptose 1,7-bisphosphate phosphatase
VIKAVFLDRDGVINRNVFYPDTGEYESPRTVSAFELFPDSLLSLFKLQEAGYRLFLVSNQPNIAKSKSTWSELQEIQMKFEAALALAKIEFVAFFYCYHHPASSVPDYGGPCECRKPSPYFLTKAAADYSVDLSQSWMVGDRGTDIECGKRAGVRTILIVPDGGLAQSLPQTFEPDHLARNLSEATSLILGRP